MILDLPEHHYILEPLNNSVFLFKCDDKNIENVISSNSKRVKIEVKPKILDMPILVRLNNDIVVSERNKICGYIVMPVGIAIYARFGDNRYMLDEIKPELKRIYFGQLTGEGSLSYLHYVDWSVKPPDKIREFEAVMLVEISNMLSETYRINSFQIFPKNIQIYIKGNIIFTNKGIINIVREDEVVFEYDMSSSISRGELLEDALEGHDRSVISTVSDIKRYFRR